MKTGITPTITPALKGVKNFLTYFELTKAPFRAGGSINSQIN
jgi:hypothetical protein